MFKLILKIAMLLTSIVSASNHRNMYDSNFFY